uniref:Ig-like domain-containing protein n=1 Tax=Salinicola aestuarinus TaxID=1949082 RepID=UPI001300962B
MVISAKIAPTQEAISETPAITVDDGTITLSQPRHILLNLSPDDVTSLTRDGNDLVVQTDTGEIIRIENFYGDAAAPPSQLYLTGEDQQLILADLGSAASNGIVPADYVPLDEYGVFEPLASESSEGGFGTLGLLAAGGALAAGAVVAGGGGGGGGGNDDNNDDAPPAPPADNIAPDAPAAVAVNADGTVVSGSAEPGATVTVTDEDGNTLGSDTADEDGDFDVAIEPAQNDGEALDVVATDDAGNSSDPTRVTAPDNTAPDAPTDVAINDDGTVVTGSAEPNATVSVTDEDGNTLGSDTADDDGSFDVAIDPPQNDGEALDVVATDDAGNNSDPTRVTAPDNTAPDAPVIALADDTGVDATDGMTNDATVTVGNLADDATWEYSTDGGETWTRGTGGSFELAPGRYDANDIQARQSDGENNVSAIDSLGPVVVDLTAPGEPTLDPTDGTTVTGMAEPGSLVTLTNGEGETIGTAPTNANGNWSFQPVPLLQDGTTVAATAADSAGNVSEPATTVIDTDLDDVIPPVAPTIAFATDDVDPVAGRLNDEDFTNDTTPTLTGSAEAGSEVTIYANDEVLGTALADNQGNWTYTIDGRDDGSVVFTATATDADGNVSDPSALFTLTIDTVAPAAPVIDTSDGEILTGMAEPNATIELTVDGESLGTTTTSPEGNWSFAPETPLDDGTVVEAVATDQAGNISDPASVTTDADLPQPTGPAAPELVAAMDQVDPTGMREDGEATNDTMPTLLGFAEANSDVVIMMDDEVMGTTVADPQGRFAFSPDEGFDPGLLLFRAFSIGQNGLVSDTSDVFSLALDTTAPNAPIIDPTDGETVTGTAEAGSTVTLRDADDNVLGTVPADENGNWSFTPTPALVDGEPVTATATDAAGNTGPEETATVDVDFDDQTPPVAPTLNGATDDVAPIAGEVDNGASTNDASPRLNGQAEAGSTVTIFQDDVEIGTTTAGNDGTWSFPVQALPDGEVTFSATATDANGNESVASDPFTLTIDTTAPDAPIIDPTDGETVTGTAEAGSTVTLTDADDNVLGTTPADENGNWSFTPTPALVDGEPVTATATDAAGNTGPEETATVDVDFDDQTPPVAPTLNGATDDVAPITGEVDSGASTNDATPRL